MKKILATSLVTGETIEFYDGTKADERFKIVPSEREQMLRRILFGASTRGVDAAIRDQRSL